MDVKEEYVLEIESLLSGSVAEQQPPTTSCDYLQKAIIGNNVDVAIYCLVHKVYPDIYHPPCNDYLHLACKLGREHIVKMLMEHRPDDFCRKGRACYPGKCLHEPEETARASRDGGITAGQTPLDVAVKAEQMACVHALVRCISFQRNIEQTTFLCDIDHPQALALFLKGPVHITELKNAYQHCLRKKRDRCLQTLFDYGFDEYSIRGMNPYHFLFQYTSGFNCHPSRHENLCATASCLIRQGVVVHQCRPAGSYPLYSLLDLIMKDAGSYGEEYYSDSVSRELLSCLRLLLRQGVRLDLDESFLSLSREDETEVAVYGRELFRSVFDVISSNAASALTMSIGSSELIKGSVDILLSHSAARPLIRPSDLSGLIKLLVRAIGSRSIARNLEAVIYQLLCRGVAVSTPIQLPYGVNTSYMVTYALCQYVEALCDRDPAEGDLQQTLSGNPVIRWLVNSMSYNSLCHANQINLRILSTKGTACLTRQLITYVSRPPLLRLKTLAAKVIRDAVARDSGKLERLPLPRSLKSSIQDIILKEI